MGESNCKRSLHFRFIDEDYCADMASQSPHNGHHLAICESTYRELMVESDQDHYPSPPRPSYYENLEGYSSPWTLSPLQTPSPSLLYACIASVRCQDSHIHTIAVSKDVAFTGSGSHQIKAWRASSCSKLGHLNASSGNVRTLLAHGDTLFSAHKDRKIRVWKFTDSEVFRPKKVSTLPRRRNPLSFWFPRQDQQQLHKDSVSCMAYYQQQGLLYTGSNDKTVKVWRIATSECVDSFVAHEDSLTSIVVNQHDGSVFTSSIDGSIKLWRRVYGESHTLTLTLRFQNSPINALALSLTNIVHSNVDGRRPGNYFLYSGSSDGIINFWEKEKIAYRFNHGGFLHGHRFGILCLAAVQKVIFSGSEDCTIRVWRREEGSYLHECLVVLDGHRGPVKCLAASLEMDEKEGVVKGFLVHSGSLDQTFKVWKVKVLPEENEVLWLDDCGYSEKSNYEREVMLMSPVLSPSWVEKKRIQTSSHFFS